MSQIPGQVPSEADSRPNGAVESARQEASGLKDTTQAEAGHVLGTAKEEASHVAHEAKSQLKSVYSQTQSELKDQAAGQQRRVADGLRTIGHELQSLAVGEAPSNPGIASDLVRQASTRLTDASSWLEDREPGDLLHEVKNFARRKPGVFIAGALVAGLAAGRLTRALAESAHDESDASGVAGAGAAPRPVTTPPVPPVTTTPASTPPAVPGGTVGGAGTIGGTGTAPVVGSSATGAPVTPPVVPPTRNEGTPVYDRSRAQNLTGDEGSQHGI
ncbi:hypothetical protein QWJ90_00365 [Microbacterium oryzae]|uniref:hypothetical protein n=1 Tax=Microbacterium oryzae TaxID=743009 RepID=UPI0025B23B4B|nr:hypothetical protein [Microbacterium oryzae]MDN3309381.1 hypothetical protein [Microbacterium oryzae]